MSLHRFYVQNINGKPELEKNEIEHARKVLRMNIGDKFISFDGFGNTWNCEFDLSYKIKINDHKFTQKNKKLSRLIISLFKFDRLEWAIEKCTELGINEIILTKTKYSQFDLKIAEKKLGRWQEITISASKQSKRVYIPELKIMKLENILKLGGKKFVGVTEFEVKLNLNFFPWKDVKRTEGVNEEGFESSILIGPEGGFEKQELDEIIKSGFEPVRLSDNILRSETACVVGSYLICN